jgi:NTE family protein
VTGSRRKDETEVQAGVPSNEASAPKPPKLLNLALQGGGSHGALTWGVLDRLLEDPRIDFDGISGASAGAINGALLVYGLLAGGRAKAREILSTFWERVANSSVFGQLKPPWLPGWVPGLDNALVARGLDALSRTFSPYVLNPLNYNPLRNLLEDSIDFAVIRESDRYGLFVGATNVLSGAMRIFRSEEMNVEALLASACLPFLFQAIEIDGEHYWDGGYLGNPTLYPLIKRCRARDILLVQINPTHRKELPTDAVAITDRMNEISFNAALQSELGAIVLINRLLHTGKLTHNADGLKEMYLHRIGDERHMADYGAITKMSTDRALIDELHDHGYTAAGEWLETHFADLGRRSTYDPEPATGQVQRAVEAAAGA